jgi:hypothetical protein
VNPLSFEPRTDKGTSDLQDQWLPNSLWCCSSLLAIQSGFRIFPSGPGTRLPWKVSSLLLICIPSSIRHICARCIDSRGLLSLTFEPNARLSRIGESAFHETRLTSICLPSSVEIIGDFAFDSCRYLQSVFFESDSHLLRIGPWGFFGCERLHSICIPASVVSFGWHCFRFCTSLRIACFEPDSQLSRIGPRIFQYCVSLSSVCIPSSLGVLLDGCFSRCTDLQVVTFESDSGLSQIECAAFEHCSSLSLGSLPSEVAPLFRQAFSKLNRNSVRLTILRFEAVRH